MEKKHTLVFSYDQNEVRSAINYLAKTNANDIKFFSPTISGQLELKKLKFADLLYQELQYSDPDISLKLENTYAVTQNTVNFIRRKLSQVRVVGIGVVDILQIILETEFVEVFYAYNLFKKLEKIYKPNLYLFPKNLKVGLCGWHAEYFSHAALIKEFYVPTSRRREYQVQPSSAEKLIGFSKYMSRLKILLTRLPLLGQRLWFTLKSPNFIHTLPSQTRLLWFSAGFNLYYYKGVIDLMRQNSLLQKTVIVTDNQTLADEVLLLKSEIQFWPLKSFKDNFTLRNTSNLTIDIYHKLETECKDRGLALFPDTLPNMVKAALHYKLRLVFKHYLSRTIERALLADKVIDKVKPKILITTHDPGPSALPFVYSAKQKKIKTLLLLHGLHQSRFSTIFESDRAIIWGKKMQDWYVNHAGKSKSALYPLGFPYLDDLFRKRLVKKFDNKSLFLSLPIKVGILVAFYVPTYGLAGYLNQLFAAVSQYKSKILLHIRSHQGQLLTGAEHLAHHYNIQVVFNKQMTIDEFTREQDVLVTWDTTAMIWAMIYGKPLYFAPPWWGSGQIPVEYYAAAYIPKNAADLVQSIINLPQKEIYGERMIKGQQKFLRQYIGDTSGYSAEKYLNLLNKLINV